MNILYLNSGTQDVLTKTTYLMKAAKEMGLENVRLWEHVPAPKYVLNIQPYYRGFKNGVVWTGTWEIDCLINRHKIAKYWDQANTVFLANRTSLLAEPPNTEYLYQACDPTFYNNLETPQFDFVHTGSLTDKNYYLDFGREEPSDMVDIYGERKRLITALSHKYSYRYFGKRLPILQYIRTLSMGRVQFIRSMDMLGESEIAQRFFECLPIGPVLTNYSEDLKYLDLEEGVDYLSYIDDEECFEKMEMLLKNDKLRNEIATNGRNKALKNHTYKNRLTQILDYLSKNYGF